MKVVPLLVAALAANLPAVGRAACAVESGPGTAALIELYTSEGCSSCPPADRQLGQLHPDSLQVPLALHVGYWDDLGWRDPYAQDGFARRQSWLAGIAGRRSVYTPQFFVGGADTGPGGVAAAVRRLNVQPPLASIRLQAQGGDALAIGATGSSSVAGAALYVVVAESGLSSQVRSGENGGRRLAHDHVVRVWIGPLDLVGGSAELHRSVPLDRTWQRAQLEVAAFVQDRRDGRVLQAVGVGQCAGT